MYTIKAWHPHDEIVRRLSEAGYAVGKEIRIHEIANFVEQCRRHNLNTMFVGHEVFVDSRLFRQR